MRVAVKPIDEVHSRAAASLVSDPRVGAVGMIGKKPPKSWGSRAHKVSDGSGFDVVAGSPGSRTVSPDATGDISFAGLTGLARSLATRLDDVAVSLDRTVTAEVPGKGDYAIFPAPLGAIRRSVSVEGVMLCPTDGSMAGVSVSDGVRTLAMVDQVLFASGVCLAAGALLTGHEGPVWDAAEAYLGLCEDMGLVFAEAISDES